VDIFSPEYLQIVMPFIVALVMVGAPGIISLIDMLIRRKENKAKKLLDEKKSASDANQVAATVADTQVGTSLELLSEMKLQYTDMKQQHEALLMQVKEMENTIHNIEYLNAQCATEISELKKSETLNKELIKKLSFEQLVNVALNSHMYTVIHIYLKQMLDAKIIPACELKTREEISREVVIAERRKNADT